MLRRPLLVAALLAFVVGMQQSSGASSGIHNGRIAYAHVGNGNHFQIYTITATGKHRRHLTSGHRYSSYGPAYSPSGKRIAFVHAGRSPDIWTIDANGSHKRALTRTTGEQETDPVWSPDGKWIAFAVLSPPPEQGIWLMRADGSGGRAG